MELGPTLTEFYSPNTSSERKQQLEQALHSFRTSPNAHLTSLEIIIATTDLFACHERLVAIGGIQTHCHQPQGLKVESISQRCETIITNETYLGCSERCRDVEGQRREQQDLFVLYFCGCTVESCMRRRWSVIPKEERLNVRKFLLQYLAASHETLPRWVFTKLGKALVDVGKTSWPSEDPTFLTDLEQLASNAGTRVVGLHLFSLVSEEFVRPDSPLPNARKKELKMSLVWAMPNVLHILAEVVAGAQDAACGTGGAGGAAVVSEAEVRNAREAILSAARCLLVIVSWAPLTEHLTIELFRSLFNVIEAAARGAEGVSGNGASVTSPSLQECGVTCVACVTEVVSKRLLPPEQQDMVLGMGDHMLSLLKIVVSEGSIRAGLDEYFLLEMAEFLGAFMEANLGRLLGMGGCPQASVVSAGDDVGVGVGEAAVMQAGSASRREPYPIAELLSLLAVFTFAHPTMQCLLRCLRAWSAFVAVATLEEGEGSPGDAARSAALARENAGGLQLVCRGLLEKSLFVTNADGLEELDGDDGGDVGKGRRGAGDDWGEEEDAVNSPDLDADGSLGELEDFIREVRGLLLAASRIPGVGAAVSENVLGAFSTVLEQLGQVSASPDGAGSSASKLSSGAAQQARRLAMDASTLCSLMAVAAAAATTVGDPANGSDGRPGQAEDGGRDLVMRAGQAVVEAAGSMATARLHERGPEFATLEASALDALSSLLPGLMSSGAGDVGNPGEARSMVIAEAVVDLVRRCLEGSGAGDSGGTVSAAACRLLLSLMSVFPSSVLERSTGVGGLLKDASQVARTLPAEARVLLYMSLSTFLMPPKLLEGDMAKLNDLEGRSRAYTELVSPVLGTFSATLTGWQGWGGPPPWPGFADAGVEDEVSCGCRILSRLCKAFVSTPSKARRVLHQAIAPALLGVLALVPPTLEVAASGASKEAASMARALLRLQVAVVDCLGQEAGPSFTSSAVGSLHSSSPSGVGGGGSSGATGEFGGTGPPWLSSAVFRLLTSVMRVRNASTRLLVPQACELALGRLHALGRLTNASGINGWGDRWLEGSVVDALPEFLGLTQELLVTQWHCFVPPAANRGMGGTSIADAIAARAQHASVSASEKTLSGGNGQFASDVMAGHFDSLMSILRLLLSAPSSVMRGSETDSFVSLESKESEGTGQQQSVPPDLVRRCLCVLDTSHRGRGLFRFAPFMSTWLQPMLTDALRGLTESAHPLLKEDVGMLVFHMAEIDHRAFATEFLSHFLSAYYPWLGFPEREALLAPWRVGQHLDAPTFALSLEAFVSDLAFFRAQAEAA